jgi:hypothetical protein
MDYFILIKVTPKGLVSLWVFFFFLNDSRSAEPNYRYLHFLAPKLVMVFPPNTQKFNKTLKEKKRKKKRMLKRNTNQKNLLLLTKIHNIKTKHNTTETKPETPPSGPCA